MARVLGFVHLRELDPNGSVSLHVLARDIAENYAFQKFPQTLEDFDLKKGVEFLDGRSGARVIDKLGLWDGLITVETRTSTVDSKEFMGDLLDWAVDRYVLPYRPGLIARYGYISDVTFHSDVRLLAVHPALERIARQSSSELSSIWEETVEYEPISLRVGHDPQKRKSPIAPFSIERWGKARFSENKYFSEAPLPTDLHWRMLEKFEEEMTLKAL